MILLATHTLLLLTMGFMLGSCVTQLIMFISNQGLLGSHGAHNPMLRDKSLGDWTENERQYVFSRLLTDLLLVCMFVLQHSLMARDFWKDLLQKCNIFVSQRLIYIIASCFVLQQMIVRWMSTPDVILWWIDTVSDGRSLQWLFFFLLHTAAWCILFLQVAVMDPLELIGIKQVFNYYKGLGPPLSNMPKRLRIFYQHMRHAGPTSLLLMLWVHPAMTLDRFLLALLFSLYLTLANRVSLTDYKFAHKHFVVQETTTSTTTHRYYRD